jgi:uncharacterized protein with HEPN domain
MSDEIYSWLNDILQCTLNIENFVQNTKDYDAFVKDLKTRSAVERNIEIIAEAINRISKKDDSIELTNARKIISTRNKIVHGYDYISNEVIWEISQKHIYPLRSEVALLISKIDY